MSISSSPSGKRLEALIAFSGIVLVALNLRAAVVSLPPIYQQIALSFPVSVASRSFMGTLPLVCFALFGLLARRASHLFGLEKSLLIAMVMVAAGELTRAWLSQSMLVFGFISVICLGGMGMGNVLLPSAITHYFRNCVRSVSGIFQCLMVVSASLPSLIAISVTTAMGWRSQSACGVCLGFSRCCRGCASHRLTTRRATLSAPHPSLCGGGPW